jgi:lipoprotein-anchoring transpeptidase ErfK/SrfK
VLLASPLGAKAHANVIITIDKTTQHMTVWVDGIEQYTWPVSTGRPGYATPSGTYTPFRMEPDHFSKESDNAPMPHSIFFTQIGHAIHGSYEDAEARPSCLSWLRAGLASGMRRRSMPWWRRSCQH